MPYKKRSLTGSRSLSKEVKKPIMDIPKVVKPRRSTRQTIRNQDDDIVDLKLRNARKGSMSKEEPVVRTPKVVLKKIKIKDETCIPSSEEMSPESCIRSTCRKRRIVREESLPIEIKKQMKNISEIVRPLRSTRQSVLNQVKNNVDLKPNNTEKCSVLKKYPVLKTPKIVLKKIHVKNEICISDFEHDSSTDSGIGSFLSIKEESDCQSVSQLESVVPIVRENDHFATEVLKEKPKLQRKLKSKNTSVEETSIVSNCEKKSFRREKSEWKNLKDLQLKQLPKKKNIQSSEFQCNSSSFFKDEAACESSIKEESVIQVLTHQEFESSSNEKTSSFLKSENISNSEDSNSDSDWEDVEESKEQNLEDYNPVIPKDGVEITIACPELNMRKRKKKQFNQMDHIRRCINRERRENQLNAHKTHLLCLLAHGLYVNDLLNSSVLKARALSLIPADILALTAGRKIDKIDSDKIKSIVSWFRKSFTFENKQFPFINIHKNLHNYFQDQKSLNASEYNLMLIIIARTLGFKTRLCISFYPITHKAKNLLQKSGNKKSGCSRTVKLCKKENTDCKLESSLKSAKVREENINKFTNSDFSKNKKLINPPGNKKSNYKRSVGKNYKVSSEESDTEDDFFTVENHQKRRSNPKRSVTAKKNYKISGDEMEEWTDTDDEEFTVEINKKRKFNSKRSVAAEKNCETSSDESSIEDRNLSVKNHQKSKPVEISSKTSKQLGRKVLSPISGPISSESSKFKLDKIVCWLEVFSKPEKQWISIECANNIINRPYNFEALLPQPVTYILAFDDESYIKDVTRRYCSEYMTSTLKRRTDSEWWEETLKQFSPPNSKLNEEEEKKLDEMLINKPLPTTVAGFKNHPLYALKRHILKFEALYPPDAAPVGFLRGEPIYPRDCVCLLHSRDTWLKEARVVRQGEEPYKMVTTLRWDKVARAIKKDVPLEIFGFWQTEPYNPPVAKGGKVPRNEYGNVDLFKPCMLPQGTVHLQLPGINRIAKKLDIDCSPAFLGFDRHKPYFCPIYDGFVVCEEYKDTLLAAWNKEQENIRKCEAEKREKRIYGNWKKLIKGLFIRERIKSKYGAK